jgi:hypothetical protein
LERSKRLLDGVLVWHGFAGRIPRLDRQRRGARVQRRQDALPQLTLDPLLDEIPVVVHARTLGGQHDLTDPPTTPSYDIRVTTLI